MLANYRVVSVVCAEYDLWHGVAGDVLVSFWVSEYSAVLSRVIVEKYCVIPPHSLNDYSFFIITATDHEVHS